MPSDHDSINQPVPSSRAHTSKVIYSLEIPQKNTVSSANLPATPVLDSMPLLLLSLRKWRRITTMYTASLASPRPAATHAHPPGHRLIAHALTSSSTGENLNPVLRSPRPNLSRLMVPVLMGSSQRKNSSVRSRDLSWLVGDEGGKRQKNKPTQDMGVCRRRLLFSLLR